MASFVIRRLIAAFLILIAATFFMYNLVALSGDPLQDLRESQAPNREQLIEARTRLLHLDVIPPLRYFIWLGGVSKCFIGQCDFGVTIQNLPVVDILARSLGSTLQLVTVATFVAIFLGILVGITTALKQYSAYDYGVTFMSFLFFSLPIFWVAVLLKQFLAIGLNDFLEKSGGTLTWTFIIAATLAMTAFWLAVLGGGGGRFRNFLFGALPIALVLVIFMLVQGESAAYDWVYVLIVSALVGVIVMLIFTANIKRTLVTAGVALASTLCTLWYISESGWFLNPRLILFGLDFSILGVAFFILAGAALAVTILSGWNKRRGIYIAFGLAVLSIALYYPMQMTILRLSDMNMGVFILFAVITIAVGGLVGWFFGGEERKTLWKVGALTTLIAGFVITVDRMQQVWAPYSNSGRIRGRPIATIGSQTPNLEGSFWVMQLDSLTHVLLPTIALLLISFAGYTRYSRASLLEVMNQDYIRTARAKGLTERTVVVRHAFRNALIPIATIVAFDIAGLIGGAVITERVFGWSGMGTMFQNGLDTTDPNPVMAFFVVTAALALVFNMLADIAYAALDPRIRVS